MHPTLRRLDDLAGALRRDPGVLAVLGLGSAGVEVDRFDEHSDIDFFLIVDTPDTKERYLRDTGWLAHFRGHLAYSFVNDPNGRKALLVDGLFLEYAIFTPHELATVPFEGARTVWCRPGLEPSNLQPAGRVPPTNGLDTVDFHLNEALTNLYVGMRRELRGEHLSAMRFIQVYAVDQVLALLRLDPRHQQVQTDPFDGTRRIEQTAHAHALPLEAMVTGYLRNHDAATATLTWLTRHYDTNPAIVDAIHARLTPHPSSP